MFVYMYLYDSEGNTDGFGLVVCMDIIVVLKIHSNLSFIYSSCLLVCFPALLCVTQVKEDVS